jgi:hypothetical protein
LFDTRIPPGEREDPDYRYDDEPSPFDAPGDAEIEPEEDDR